MLKNQLELTTFLQEYFKVVPQLYVNLFTIYFHNHHVMSHYHHAGKYTKYYCIFKAEANSVRTIVQFHKVLEWLIFNKIITHISTFISPSQFEFMRNFSTLQQLLILTNFIINSLLQTDVIYLDISKAFDTVSYQILLSTSYGQSE